MKEKSGSRPEVHSFKVFSITEQLERTANSGSTKNTQKDTKRQIRQEKNSQKDLLSKKVKKGTI